MQEQEIIEGNRLIAEFTGWKFNRLEDSSIDGYHDDHRMWLISEKEFKDLLFSGFKFHEDWNKLMPVVEKIASLLPDDVIHFEIGKTYNRVFLWSFESGKTHTFDISMETLIESTWHAVVRFIKWYNTQSK